MKSKEEVLAMSDEEVTKYIQEGKTPEDRLRRHNEIFRYGLSRAGVVLDEPTSSGELSMDTEN